ncbi:PREDICTED: G patch domain-containing protein 3-like [Branchiostoma belcheri]|uniref:G patch domain-containing protein 3-like n=1 Tax=Branchiostoma belcheri TaxID=7741 RepID=A0A6P4YZF6_BRABE|nr:PREDICTED: G patch domain-containing protein 3-like [Branchiostoma belcheri]
MADTNTKKVVYGIVGNIPGHFHSADLRNFFSQFIESGGFDCFHFRHRPEAKGADTPEETDERNVSQKGEGGELVGSETSLSAQHSQKAVGVTAGTAVFPSTSEQKVLTDYRASVDGDNAAGPSRCKEKRKTLCCVVRVLEERWAEFVKLYHGKHWVDRRGDYLRHRAGIRRVRLAEEGSDALKYQTRKEVEQRRKRKDGETISQSELQKLIELHPPDVMPRGNVGTPIKVFLELIRTCRLPPILIHKLGLVFPSTGSSRRYGNVPFDYGGRVVEGSMVLTGTGEELSAEVGFVEQQQRRKEEEQEKRREQERQQKEEEDKADESHSDDDNDTCEEWERHEALYDDVTKQGRNKERLFEEEIELKWEKGGSGLVFYTDAQFWDQMRGDFDERTTDDWDVDMSVYYDPDGGDKDARDYLQMRLEQRLRAGLDGEEDITSRKKKTRKERKEQREESGKIGQFEKHTKGLGRKIMERQGWRDGEGLGSWKKGPADALENEGQGPRDKRGFGFYGEKLDRQAGGNKRRRVEKDVVISTVYDEPYQLDNAETLTRQAGPHTLKYRTSVPFVRGSQEDKT